MATSCIRLSFCALAVSSSASLRSVSAEVPQAATSASASPADVNGSIFIGMTPPSRMVTLLLPRCSGYTSERPVTTSLNGREASTRPSSRVPSGSSTTLNNWYGRDQLHLLSHAQREDDRRVERSDPGGIHLCSEGAAAHHALRAPAKHRRTAPPLPRLDPQA